MNPTKKSPVAARPAASKATGRDRHAGFVTLTPEPFIEAVERLMHPKPQVVRKLRHEFRRLLADASRQTPPVRLVPSGDEILTTQEAADMVGVSRPFMAARIDSGDVPLFQQVGNQRRVLASAVRAWHEQSRRHQREAMKQLVQQLDEEYEN